MKIAGIILTVIAGLVLAFGLVMGGFALRNGAAADRLEARLGGRKGAWIGAVIRRKVSKQWNLALGFGIPGALGVAGGVVMIRRKRS